VAATTNNAGTIATQVAANTTAGISVITWSGTGAAGSIGHGLGVAPNFFFLHKRTPAANTNNWPAWLSGATGLGEYLYVDQTAGKVSSWNWLSSVDSSKITWGTDGQAWDATNASGCTYWMAAFAEVAGFSKFGSYTGNGSADGPFVYCGFKPRLIFVKRSDSAASGGNWYIYDSARDSYNVVSHGLCVQTAQVEFVSTQLWDFTANGFKVRSTENDINASGATYIFATFAEAPFKYATAR
jgi:hypothetical protein